MPFACKDAKHLDFSVWGAGGREGLNLRENTEAKEQKEEDDFFI